MSLTPWAPYWAGAAGVAGPAGETGDTGQTGLTGASGVTELGSVEKVDADFSTASISAPGTDVGLSLTFTVTDHPVYVHFGGTDMSHTVANIPCLLSLYAGATRHGVHRGQHTTANGRIRVGMGEARFVTPGEYTVRLTAHSESAGTLTVYAAAGAPIYLRAIEVAA